MFIKRHGKGPCSFAPAVTRRFYAYPWPGNIRQLRNFVETMVVLDTDGVLDTNDLPPELAVENDSETAGAAPAIPAALPGMGDSALIGKPMADIERWAIEETLKLTAGNRDEAAKMLGIGARTLYRKLDKYKQDDSEAAQDVSADPEAQESQDDGNGKTDDPA